MTMSHKELIESLRKKKALSMQVICGDYVSHSSYSRFVKQGQTLAIDKLLYILRQMDLSFREAGLFDHNIQRSNEDTLLMMDAMTSNDVAHMKEIADLFASKAKRTYDIYGMMAIQVRLKMGGETAAKQEQDLKDYLFKVQNWDFKEMYLFTFILDRMESSVILYYLNRTFRRAADPYFLERNLNLIILTDEAHFELLKRKELSHAQNVIEQFEKFVVNRTFHSVQGYFTISQALHNAVKEKRPEDLQKIARLYHNLMFIEASFFAKRLRSRYEELQAIYQLDDLIWEEEIDGFK
ncbi:hypothetical protein BW721_08065 [Jeotgalibaca sp. PTS2502]|uniref:Rgg family transcriptional regulator n=1 Tax=Jeotgalibaca sp. PTS2502 TaxID=1903686 RepID=UPI000973A65C|nr:hypothetical protein [Jeotgalibaca sp. PTS2502]APZ49616.1 hypothetical protein BW721_08065 [Jeotgalibaca sp. PTS2502]